MNETSTDPDTLSSWQDAREPLEFLVSSWNRLEVLEALAVESRTRADLKELVGVSRVTLSRILGDLERRGWVVRPNGRYEATSDGVFVAGEVVRTLENLRTAAELGTTMEWLPTDRFDFDVARLRDATVITPRYDDFTAQTRRLVGLVHESDRIRRIGTGIDREFMRTLRDACVDGDLTLDLVLEEGLFDAIEADADLRRLFADLTAAESARVYRYDGDEPLTMVGIHDGLESEPDVVMLCGQHEEGAPPGTIESTDGTVRAWAESFFESIRRASRPVEPAAFAR